MPVLKQLRRHTTMQVAARWRRVVLGVSVAALAVSGSAFLGGPQARAADPAADPLDPGVVGELPANLTYRLSPELAATVGTDTLDEAGARALLARRGASGLIPQQTPEVGAVRQWPALDDTGGTGVPVVGLYLKQYTLLAKGPKIEVWVASGSDEKSAGTKFPSGDCRTTKGDPTVVTAAQAQGLVNEFTHRMLPVESKLFSGAPAEDGTLSLGQLGPLGVDFRGGGDSTVTWVDNIRDPNFYDFTHNRTYIAGFFAPIFNQLTNRNVMTIDAFDWIHRTGANPKNEPNEDLCKSRPARPRAYEGVFAHEWQHLLQNYQDPAETTWVNEGLSDFAISLVGYGDPRRNVQQTHAESHIFCFHGYGTVKGPSNPNPSDCGGAENSLTMWQDEGTGSEVLADYGNAWSFMQFLDDRYGRAFISALHTDGADQGLKGLQTQLDKFAKGATAASVLHDYQLMNLLDHYAGQKGAQVKGIPASRITTKSLDSTINLENKTSYAQPGAGPNGADYILLKDGDKNLPGKALRKFDFLGNASVSGGSGADDGTVTIPPNTDSTTAGAKVDNWYVTLVGLDPK